MCLSVCSCISKTAWSHFPYFLCMLPVALARPSVHGIPIRYVLPILWMTLCFANNGPCGSVTLWQQSRCNVMYFLTLHWCMVLIACTKTRGAVHARGARGKICDAPLPCLCTFLIDLSNAVPFAWRFFRVGNIYWRLCITVVSPARRSSWYSVPDRRFTDSQRTFGSWD